MRQYKDPSFGIKVAEHAMDLLDDRLFRTKRATACTLPGNNLERANLERAGAATARQAREILFAMHALEKAWLDVCKVTLPSHLPPGYAERLKVARWELLDLSDELDEIWQAKASAIWSTLPVESRVRRLRQMAEEAARRGEGTEERSIWADHLSFRVGLDPEAARLAGLDPEAARLAGLDEGAQGVTATAPRQ